MTERASDPTEAPPSGEFERAADLVVEGRLEELRRSLDRWPALVRAHSARTHRGTLLHYAATNGVEDERQRVSEHAVEIAELLIERGADIHAEGAAYGGVTPLEALVTSAHPLEAGVMSELVRAFGSGGQSLEGPNGDGAPLLLALLFRNGEGARTLVECGASPSDAVAWAGLGHTESLARAVRPGPPPEADPPRCRERPFAPDDAVRTVEWALIAAASTGATDSVRFLLTTGVALDGRWSHTTTALHEAAWGGYLEVVDLLLQAGAPLDARDRHHDATPLGWARHAGHHDVALRLEAAERSG